MKHLIKNILIALTLSISSIAYSQGVDINLVSDVAKATFSKKINTDGSRSNQIKSINQRIVEVRTGRFFGVAQATKVIEADKVFLRGVG